MIDDSSHYPGTPPTNPITKRLLDWYDRHHRVLPWRIAPADHLRGITPDPYRIWLSEVMLQQTTVEAVKAYFNAFIAKWPTIFDLAAASEDDVMRAWAGLGYYSRARNLKKCANTLVAEYNGQFPRHAEQLKTLPGIGDYTSAAIASIAFDEPAAVVDGNIERVISRLYAISTPLPAGKADIRARVADILPSQRSGDFAQAMMDLGASICTPKRPSCILCPIKDDCRALAEFDPEQFPVKQAKKERPVRLGAAFIAVADDGAVLLRKRGAKGLLAGMAEVPGSPWTARIDGDNTIAAAPFDADWQVTGHITHIFTHFELRLTIYLAENVRKAMSNEGWWSAPDTLGGEALPTVMKKAIAEAIPEAFVKRSRNA